MSQQFDANYYFGSVYDNYDDFLDWTKVARDLLEEYRFESFIDVGCGCGNLVKEMEKADQSVTAAGIDISTYAVTKADHANIHCASCTDLPFADNTFECVYILGTYGYLRDENEIKTAMSEACRVSSRLVVFEDVYTVPAAQSDDFDPHRQTFFSKEKWESLWQECAGHNCVSSKSYQKYREYDVIEIRQS